LRQCRSDMMSRLVEGDSQGDSGWRGSKYILRKIGYQQRCIGDPRHAYIIPLIIPVWASDTSQNQSTSLFNLSIYIRLKFGFSNHHLFYSNDLMHGSLILVVSLLCVCVIRPQTGAAQQGPGHKRHSVRRGHAPPNAFYRSFGMAWSCIPRSAPSSTPRHRQPSSGHIPPYMARFHHLWHSYLALHSAIMANLSHSLQDPSSRPFRGRVLVLEPRMDLGWGNILPVIATAAITAVITNRALLVK